MRGRLLVAILAGWLSAGPSLAAVNSWNARVGNVWPQTGDYQCSEVTDCEPDAAPDCHSHECVNRLCFEPPACGALEAVGDLDPWGNPTCRALPPLSAFVTLPGADSTTSAALEDVTGFTTTLVLAAPARIAVVASVEMAMAVGTTATLAIAVNVDGTDSDELQQAFSGATQALGTVVYRSAVLTAGTSTITMRFRRVSGSDTPGITAGTLLATVVR